MSTADASSCRSLLSLYETEIVVGTYVGKNEARSAASEPVLGLQNFSKSHRCGLAQSMIVVVGTVYLCAHS
jgi:hypothetical protein